MLSIAITFLFLLKSENFLDKQVIVPLIIWNSTVVKFLTDFDCLTASLFTSYEIAVLTFQTNFHFWRQISNLNCLLSGFFEIIWKTGWGYFEWAFLRWPNFKAYFSRLLWSLALFDEFFVEVNFWEYLSLILGFVFVFGLMDVYLLFVVWLFSDLIARHFFIKSNR